MLIVTLICATYFIKSIHVVEDTIKGVELICSCGSSSIPIVEDKYDIFLFYKAFRPYMKRGADKIC